MSDERTSLLFWMEQLTKKTNRSLDELFPGITGMRVEDAPAMMAGTRTLSITAWTATQVYRLDYSYAEAHFYIYHAVTYVIGQTQSLWRTR